MNKKEFVAIYVLLKQAMASKPKSTEDVLSEAIKTWDALSECKEVRENELR